MLGVFVHDAFTRFKIVTLIGNRFPEVIVNAGIVSSSWNKKAFPKVFYLFLCVGIQLVTPRIEQEQLNLYSQLFFFF
jgi:hypothetical protein